MYGPPPFRKRKVKLAGWSAQMYTSTKVEGVVKVKDVLPVA